MHVPVLDDIVAIFGLSIFVLIICHRIKIPSIVGLLITGVLCGPTALGLVSDVHAVEILAEVGVIFLLFTIGMELSGAELARLRKPIFISGSLQVVLTAGFTCLYYFYMHEGNLSQSIFYGCLTSLSSTAIVLSLFQQKGLSESPQGRMSLSILVLQDIVIIPMMLMIPVLAGTSKSGNTLEILMSAGKTVTILGSVFVLAKYIVPRLMSYIVRTKNRELLLTSTIALCLAVALGTSQLGLSVSLGAFLAGLLLAESEYSLSVVEGILPFKEVFTSVFFISVGMLLNIEYLMTHLGSVFLWAVCITIVKSLIIIPCVLAIGYPLRIAITTGISLAQIGEFAFVLAGTGLTAGLLNDNSYQLFLAGSLMTMTLTPALMHYAPIISNFVADKLHIKPIKENAEHSKLKDHLIIVGFGVGGKYLARTAKETHIDYNILEMNVDTVKRYKNEGEPIMHGDATREVVLDHLGIKHARVLAIVISDPAAVRAITSTARKLNPNLHIVVRTRFLGEVHALKRLGADDVIPEDFETSIEIFTRVLSHYLIPNQEIERFVELIRNENYDMMRDLNLVGSNLPNLDSLAFTGIHVMSYIVEAESMAIGKNIIEIDLRKNYNVTVAAIRRGSESIVSPGTTNLLEGDVVYLFGEHDAILKAKNVFCVN